MHRRLGGRRRGDRNGGQVESHRRVDRDAAARGDGRSKRAELSEPARARAGRLRAGRPGRHDRPHRRRQAFGILGPARADRERHRRRRQCGRRPRRQGRARRLHAADGEQRADRRQPVPLREDAVRSGQGSDHDLAVGVHAKHPGRTQRRAGENRTGAGGLCALAAGQADLCLRRHRNHATSRRRAVQVDGQARHPARTVSRRDAGHHRPARRPRHHVLRQYRAARPAGARRQAAGARRHFGQAVRRGARTADHDRGWLSRASRRSRRSA